MPVAFRGLAFSGLSLVAVRIQFLGWGGQLLVVGWVVGLAARWLLRPSQVVMLPVHWGLAPGGVGRRVVVLVVGVVMVVPVVVLVVMVVVVVGLVVVVVLRVCSQAPVVLQLDRCLGHNLPPFALQRLVEGWSCYWSWDEWFHVPETVLPAMVVVCRGRMAGLLEMGLWPRVWMGSCCVGASVSAVRAGGMGARDALGVGFWWRGRLYFCCGRPCCGCWP